MLSSGAAMSEAKAMRRNRHHQININALLYGIAIFAWYYV